MSGAVRAGLIFGLAAIVAFIAGLFLPIPCVNIILAFGSVIALGWGAGYTADKWTGANQSQRIGRGATAGAIGGLVVLIGSLVAFIALSGVILSLPGVREQIATALQENPDAANLNPDDLQAAVGVGFGFIGFCLGVINFVLMLLGGVIGGAMWKGAAATSAYVPAGGTSYVPDQGYGQQPGATYGQQPYGQQPGTTYGQQPGTTYQPPQDTGEARVYDPNDPNRPQ